MLRHYRVYYNELERTGLVNTAYKGTPIRLATSS